FGLRDHQTLSHAQDGQVAKIAGSTYTGFVYDKYGRLVRECLTTACVSGQRVEFDYAPNGLITRMTGPKTATSYVYDKYGNLARLKTPNGSTVIKRDSSGAVIAVGADRFTFDGRGDLGRAVVGKTTVTYTYDSFGRMVARTQNGDTTRVLWDETPSGST